MTSRSKQGSYKLKENARTAKPSPVLDELVNFNFKYLDTGQPSSDPQSFSSWSEENLLVNLADKLYGISSMTMREATTQQQIKVYGNFPNAKLTDFEPPISVDENARWAVIKNVGGQKRVVAGFIRENTFYVVFLDKDHRFWISQKS